MLPKLDLSSAEGSKLSPTKRRLSRMDTMLMFLHETARVDRAVSHGKLSKVYKNDQLLQRQKNSHLQHMEEDETDSEDELERNPNDGDEDRDDNRGTGGVKQFQFNFGRRPDIDNPYDATPSSRKPDKDPNSDKCLCCAHLTEGRSISLWASLSETYHLGSGYSLYFQFNKYLLIMLIIIFGISGGYNLATNYQGHDCLNAEKGVSGGSYCYENSIMTLTIASKRNNAFQLRLQVILNLVSVVFIMLFFHYMRYRFRKTAIEVDDRTVTPSDYTCAISNLDPLATNQEVRKWIQAFSTKEHPIEIERLIRPVIGTKMRDDTVRVGGFKKKVAVLPVVEGERGPDIIPIHSRTFYVTLKRAQQCAYIQGLFKQGPFSGWVKCFGGRVGGKEETKFKGVQVYLKPAPEPTDIKWDNLKVSHKERSKLKKTTNLGATVIGLFSLGMILAANWGQLYLNDLVNNDWYTVQAISIGISLGINLTNTLLTFIIEYMTSKEKHNTNTSYLKSVSQKLTVSLFFNTALNSLFVQIILSWNTKTTEDRLQRVNYYGKAGLLESIFWVFVTNTLLPAVVIILNPIYIFKKIRQHIILASGTKVLNMTQKAANTIFEGYEMDLPVRYANMIKILLLTSFYAPALPITLVFTIAGLFLYYWAEKYVLLRRAALPIAIGHEAATEMVEYAKWTSFTFSAGNIMYVYTLKNSKGEQAFDGLSFVLAFIMLGIGIIQVVLPMNALNEYMFPIKDEVTEVLTYRKAKKTFRDAFNIDYNYHEAVKRVEQKRRDSMQIAAAEEKGGSSPRGLNSPQTAQTSTPLSMFRPIKDDKGGFDTPRTTGGRSKFGRDHNTEERDDSSRDSYSPSPRTSLSKFVRNQNADAVRRNSSTKSTLSQFVRDTSSNASATPTFGNESGGNKFGNKLVVRTAYNPLKNNTDEAVTPELTQNSGKLSFMLEGKDDSMSIPTQDKRLRVLRRNNRVNTDSSEKSQYN